MYKECVDLWWFNEVHADFINIKDEGVSKDDFDESKCLGTFEEKYTDSNGAEECKFQHAIWDYDGYAVMSPLYGKRVFSGITYNLERIVSSPSFHTWADKARLSVWCGHDEFDKVFRYRQLVWEIRSLNKIVEESDMLPHSDHEARIDLEDNENHNKKNPPNDIVEIAGVNNVITEIDQRQMMRLVVVLRLVVIMIIITEIYQRQMMRLVVVLRLVVLTIIITEIYQSQLMWLVVIMTIITEMYQSLMLRLPVSMMIITEIHQMLLLRLLVPKIKITQIYQKLMLRLIQKIIIKMCQSLVLGLIVMIIYQKLMIRLVPMMNRKYKTHCESCILCE